MNYLSIENVSKSFEEKSLFENVTLHINEGQKVALVAKNGAGKSSLMNIIMGKEAPDSGSIYLHKSIKTAFLEQDPFLPPNVNAFDAIYLSDNPVMLAVARYERCMSHTVSEDELQNSLNDMDRLNAWDYEARIKTILAKLKIEDCLELNISQLSGGQKKRVALAKAIIDDPDFIILDEPTNHLDLEMIEWLEEYLSRSSLTLFMITHDRYFLEAVCDTIVELDGGQLYKYNGSYSYYLERKAERDEGMSATAARTRNLYVKELDWMRRQPQARGTKAKSRIDAFFEIEKKVKNRSDNDELVIEIQMNRIGSKVIELYNVGKSYPDKVLIKNFEYKFKPNDRVGIIGNNGMGKTTLLEMLTGQAQPDSGKVVIGDTVVLGYYTQHNMQFKEGLRVIDAIKEIAEFIPLKGGKKLQASQLLERFLFDHAKQQSFIYKLSGGEKRRLFLLTILMKNPNVLILDEPTNDLDVVTLQSLEEFLSQYEGCLIIVSHDRHFMDKLVEHTFVFEGQGVISDYPGNYSSYRALKAAKKGNASENKNTPATTNLETVSTPTSSSPKPTRKEVQKIEREIAKFETRKSEIHELFLAPTITPDEIAKLSKELAELDAKIEAKELEWLELNG